MSVLVVGSVALDSVETPFGKADDVLGQEAPLQTARLALARAAQIVLRNGLEVLGISAPDRM